jgi:Haem-binding domain
MNRKRVKRLLLVVAALAILAQVIQPRRTNPTVDPSRALAARITVPSDVQTILNRGCADCHSNRTVWPWYSRVAPLSWILIDDVNQGRRHINFSDWAAQKDAAEAATHIQSICDEVRRGTMPPLTYRMLHKTARLSPTDIEALCTWSQTVVVPAQDGSDSGN